MRQQLYFRTLFFQFRAKLCHVVVLCTTTRGRVCSITKVHPRKKQTRKPANKNISSRKRYKRKFKKGCHKFCTGCNYITELNEYRFIISLLMSLREEKTLL